MKSEIHPYKSLPIGNLYNLLASYEANKGQIKRLTGENDATKAVFADKSEGENAVFVTDNGQKCASVAWQTRASLDRESLKLAGVPDSVLDACTLPSRPFAVLRVH